jgi:serine/threonine-protein kinase RsbW/stage II sporulation protein AB (anti-sigma F factor)
MVVAYAAEQGMTGTRLSELALAVGEAVANAVVHAYRGRSEGMVEVSAALGDGLLFVAVRDRGGGVVPREDSPGLGLGLPLISQIADDFRISEREGGGTELRMSFVKVALPAPTPAGRRSRRRRRRSTASISEHIALEPEAL